MALVTALRGVRTAGCAGCGRGDRAGQMAQDLVFLDLLTCGGVFFGPPREVGEELHPAGCGYSMRVVFAFLDSVFDALPGAVMVTMNGVLAKHYAGPGPGWGTKSGVRGDGQRRSRPGTARCAAVLGDRPRPLAERPEDRRRPPWPEPRPRRKPMVTVIAG